MKLEDIYKKFNLQSAEERRSLLISEMNSCEDKELSCKECVGHCCTYISNSMKIDALEALEIYEWLQNKNLWNEELQKKLVDTIKSYRLDVELLLKKGQDFRRTYTCPFYLGHKKGCSLSPKIKPYGCLAFNADEKNVTEWGHCSSRQELLQMREDEHSAENEANTYICNELGLTPSKKPIPMALIEIHKKRM